MEVISRAVVTIYPYTWKYFVPTDVYNALQGVVIFVLFVCKQKIWLLLKKKFGRPEENILITLQTNITRNQ
jgi:hypothetical protein